MATADSSTDRALIHAAIDRIEERCQKHDARDDEIKTWMRDADRDLSRIKLVGLVTLALVGALAGGARWAIRSAVTEAMVDHGLLELHPHAAVAPQKGPS
jgi:hypothetical protein